jgi:cellulose synthase/poly-beta-1,6-N-acetylglucosamine synthase-like glycosyltransferase
LKIVIFLIIGAIVSGLIVYNFFSVANLFTTFEGGFLRFSIILVAFFTFIVIFRYISFIFFSIMKTTQKTIDFQHNDIFFNPKVTIIVPAYNEDVTIAVSIKSLVKQTYNNLEIIIMDDGSKDNTYKIAKKFEGNFEGKTIKVLTKKNGGKSRALNFAIERSSGELVMCVDADSKLEKDAVELMVRYFKNSEISAVAGSVFVSNRINVLTKLQALEYIEGLNMVRNAQAYLQLVNIIPGPIGMFRKSAIQEVGGYAHDTFAEDCDLTLKLIETNHKIDFEPDAVAHTEAPDELLDLLKQRYRWTRGILQAIQKHSGSLWNFKNFNFSFVLWYMLFEAIFWPFIDLFNSFLLMYLSFAQGINTMLIYWWLLFTIVDISGALYCILITNETKSLSFYAILYRLYFISVINISKIFATIEEWFQIEMSWGKLDRKGI